MNRNAKIAIGFTLAALVVTAAEAQNTVRVEQRASTKNLIVSMQNGGGYSYSTGTGGAQGEGQSNSTKDDLFAGTEQFEKNASEVSEITMDPESLDMVKGAQSAKAQSMLLNVVRSYEYDKPGLYDMAAVEKFRVKLNTGDWHCSVHTRELKTGESTDVCYKRRTDGYREEAIISVEPKELTFIHRITRANGDGHSEMSGLPLMIGPGSFPLVAELNGSVMRAEMAASMAEMRAMSPELYGLKARLYEFQSMKPLDTKQFEELGKSLKEFKVVPRVVPDVEGLPNVKVLPLPTEPPAAPAAPKPDE